MELTLYQIDAFAGKPFEGNPAAVCPLDSWLPDEAMQSIAEENNLSETAFFVPTDNGFDIRWFTPTLEIDLCGHATLASAYVLFNILGFKKAAVEFMSKSGILRVSKRAEWFVMDLPSQPPLPREVPPGIVKAFGKTPPQCLSAEDFIVVFDNEEEVLSAAPNFEELKKLDLRGVVITAASKEYDFVARFFAPKYGISEDPVTGSAYTQLTPLWAEKLGKTRFRSKQLSKRGGELLCELQGDRVKISGKAVKYLEGKIQI